MNGKFTICGLALLLFLAMPTPSLFAAEAPVAFFTKDNDGDGKIDRLLLQFGADIDATSIPDYDGWSVKDGAFTYAFTGSPSVDNTPSGTVEATITLFVVERTTFDGGNIPDVTYNSAAGDVKYSSTNAMASIVGGTIIEQDDVDPIFVSAVTVDDNSNGRIDAYDITFSETVTVPSTTSANRAVTAGQFGVTGHTEITTLNYPSNVIRLTFNELPTPNTGETPALAYTATGSNDIEDLATTANLVATDASITVKDGVRPFVLDVVTADNAADGHINKLVVTYSEAMDTVTGTVYTGGVTIDDATYGAYAISSVTLSPDSTVATYELVPKTAFDTDATPTYGYNDAIGALIELNDAGNELVSTSFLATDGSAPIITDAKSGDEDADGLIDYYLVTFSETIKDQTAADYDDNFAIVGHTIADTTKKTSKTLQLFFDEIGGDKTDALPAVSYDRTTVPASEVKDLVNIPVATDAAVTEVDAASPVLLTAETQDLNANDGEIDTYKLTFSEPVKDASFNGYIDTNTEGTATSTWSVKDGTTFTYANVRIDPTVTADGDNDAIIYIKFDQKGTPDTDAKPNITTSSAVLTDNLATNANTLVAVTTSTVTEADKANPVLLQAIGQVNSTNLFVFFSEPVTSPGGASATDLETADFVYTNVFTTGTNASALSAVAEGDASDERATLTVNNTFLVGDVEQDRLSVVTANIEDTSPAKNKAVNLDGAADISIDDQISPTINTISFYDEDEDGKLDYMEVVYDESINDASVDGYVSNTVFGTNVGTVWSVPGHSSAQFDPPGRLDADGDPDYPWSDGVNDATIWFLIDEIAGTEGDTDVKPAVTTVSAAVSDFKPNVMNQVTSKASRDRAGPAIMFGSVIGSAAADVRFSEPIDFTKLGLNSHDIEVLIGSQGRDIGGDVIDAISLDSDHGARLMFQHNPFLASTTVKVSFLTAGVVEDKDANNNVNEQTSTITLTNTSGTLGAPGGTATPLAGTQGSVLEGNINRSVNDPIHSGYVTGSTPVDRYEIYVSGSDTILVAQYAPPSTDNSPGSGAYTVHFALIPPDTLPKTYFVRAVGGTGSAGAPPIEGGDAIALSLSAKPGDIVSGLKVGNDLSLTHVIKDPENSIEVAVSDLVVIGTNIVARDGIAPTAPADLSVIDDPADNDLKVLATFTKASDDGQSDDFTGVNNARFARVTGYNVYDESDNLVATLAAGVTSASFDAADRSKHTYTIAATDGANDSPLSNSNSATAADNTQTGDFTSDRTVDVSDLVLFAANFGLDSSNPEFEPLFDLNSDGVVDVSDLVIFAGVFGQSSPAPASSPALQKKEIKASSAVINVRTQSTSTERLQLFVEGDQLTDIKGYQFELKYDKNKLELESVEVGSILHERGLFVDKRNEASVLVAGAAFADVVISGKGILASYVFKVKDPIDAKVTLDEILMLDTEGELGSVESVIAEAKIIPTEFALSQNYPNPFNPETQIRFDLPVTTTVTLVIYDVTGREVRALVNGPMEAGVYRVIWNGKDNAGMNVSSGMYFYRVVADKFSQVKKMLLLK